MSQRPCDSKYEVQMVKKCSDRALQIADYVILRIGNVFMRRLPSDAQGQEEIMQQMSIEKLDAVHVVPKAKMSPATAGI